MLSRDEVDQQLARLGAEHEAIEASLLALQDHAGRRLLEGAQLTGTTAERWARMDVALTLLWTNFERGTTALVRAREIRAQRRNPGRAELSELSDLLEGDCLVISGGEQLAERVSWAVLIDRMNTGYAEVLDTVVAADAVWSALPARIDLLSSEISRLTDLARSVGVLPGQHPAGDVLREISAGLGVFRAEVIADPLSFWISEGGSSAPGTGRPDTERFDEAARAAEEVRREVDAVIGVSKDAEGRLARLRDVLVRAERTLDEARLARGEVLAKIAAWEVPPVNGTASALYEQLNAAVEHRRQGQWHRLAPLLDSLERQADGELERARASLTAVTAPLAVRAELRGRLDAYKARTLRLGGAADPRLGELYDQARRVLWSAPCDLRTAEQSVLRYQQATSQALAPQPQARPQPRPDPHPHDSRRPR